ncbi:MAG: YciI family protein [Gemmatimonadota bacterium]
MRYMMLVKASADSEAGVMPTAEQMGEMGKFNEQLINAGVLLAGDGLHPSSAGFRVQFSGDKKTIVDGPFAETKELIAGYWIIQVASREEAVEWARRIPNPQFGGETYVEVRRVFEISDFPEESFSTPDAQRARDLEVSARAKSGT